MTIQVKLEEILDLDGKETRFPVRIPEDMVTAYKWVCNEAGITVSDALRKLVLADMQQKIDNSFVGKFIKDSKCEGCGKQCDTPWAKQKHLQLECDGIPIVEET